MAHLPPKVPNVTSNWPDLHHQKMNPSWVDEFLDFSSGKRGTHRRSSSDSIAFLHAPMLEEEESCRRGGGPSSRTSNKQQQQHHEFDKFDDEQFMSMFTEAEEDMPNAAGVSCSNPTSPSEDNSINIDEQQRQAKNGSEDWDHEEPGTASNRSKSDRIVDPKRVKRILANRQSAQRSRVRKLQYISQLERSVTLLQAEVSILSPRVAFLDHQRLLLNVDNSTLKQRIAALAQDKIFKDAHQEALKREIERLSQVYHHQQSIKKRETGTPPLSAIDVKQISSEKGQLLNV